MAIMQRNQDVINVQNFWTNDALEKVGIDMKTTDFNNYNTGKPDGMLGQGTSTLIQTLIILAQREAGIAEENITTDINADTMQNVGDLLIKRGFDSDAVGGYIADMRVMTESENLMALYNTKASVSLADADAKIDQTKLAANQTPEVIPVDTNAPEDNTDISFAEQNEQQEQQIDNATTETTGINAEEIILNQEFGDVASVTAAADQTPANVIQMTLEERNTLESNAFITPLEQHKINAFDTALAELREELNYTEAKNALEEAGKNHKNWTDIRDTVRSEADDLQAQLDTFAIEIYKDSSNPEAGTQNIPIDDFKLELNIGDIDNDGQDDVQYMSKNEVDNLVGFWEFNDSDREQKLREAMEEAYAQLQEASGYNQLDADYRAKETEGLGSSVFSVTKAELDSKQQAFDDINQKINATPLDVVIPDGQTQAGDQRMVMVTPDESQDLAAVKVQGLGGMGG